MRRIAITGGAGLLGKYVVDELAGDYEVTVLDLRIPENGHARAGCRYETCDVLDRDRVGTALANHDGVIHLAGIDVAISATAEAFFETNVMGTWNVLQAAEAHGLAKAVICSSVSAIGFSDEPPAFAPERLPVDETHRLQPTHPYGLSKQVMEVVGQSFAVRGRLPVAALRPSLVVYPELLADVERHVQAVDGEGAGSVDTGSVSKDSLSPTRAYVRPDDAARCFRRALEVDTGTYDVFFVAADDSYSPEPTVQAIERRFRVSPELTSPDRYKLRPLASALDNSRAKSVLGWQPTGSWRDFVEEVGPSS